MGTSGTTAPELESDEELWLARIEGSSLKDDFGVWATGRTCGDSSDGSNSHDYCVGASRWQVDSGCVGVKPVPGRTCGDSFDGSNSQICSVETSRRQVGSCCVGAKPAALICSSKAIPFPPEVVEPETAVHASGPPSHGSVGHPLTCAAPCKYARKKNGCKDGSNCDRCHLCEWKRPPKQWPSTSTSVTPLMTKQSQLS